MVDCYQYLLLKVMVDIVPTKDGYMFPSKNIKVVGGKEVEKDIGMKKIKAKK